MPKVNLDPIFKITLSSHGAGVGARTRDTKVSSNPRQVLYSPGLAKELVTKIIDVGSAEKSIVFTLMHTAVPIRPAFDCEDQLDTKMKDVLPLHI
ncbi:hypothetical protein PoB_001793000 [Plakobranchus ocellatus]|uniref:Uncharacterized protein n=1 Tax=Plakobranchus ocellatus TaxID=259542 RepID=A0AAV3Z8E8_9GAST|nr:hypothetical protein PoB_001793000 [Plakobranchus ocellatus]